MFTLTSPGRDANDNAGLTIADVVVTVDGTVTAAASVQTTKTDGSGSGNDGANQATRIVSVTMGAGVATGKTVTVKYETSEYNQASVASTPFLTGVSDMSINVGGSAANLTSANYDPTAATPVGLIDPATGIVGATTKLDYNLSLIHI